MSFVVGTCTPIPSLYFSIMFLPVQASSHKGVRHSQVEESIREVD